MAFKSYCCLRWFSVIIACPNNIGIYLFAFGFTRQEAKEKNGRMRALGCKTIKDGITTATIFFITGSCLLITGIWIMPDVLYFPQIIILTASLVLLMTPVILLATYLKNNHNSLN